MAAFGGSRGLQPRPPEKGVFPLDHFGECSKEMTEYLSCLKDNKDNYTSCQKLAEIYLKCRMDKKLMTRQNLEDLGIKENSKEISEPAFNTEKSKERAKKGFIGGSRH